MASSLALTDITRISCTNYVRGVMLVKRRRVLPGMAALSSSGVGELGAMESTSTTDILVFPTRGDLHSSVCVRASTAQTTTTKEAVVIVRHTGSSAAPQRRGTSTLLHYTSGEQRACHGCSSYQVDSPLISAAKHTNIHELLCLFFPCGTDHAPRASVRAPIG